MFILEYMSYNVIVNEGVKKETKNQICAIEHQQDSLKGKFESSVATEHTLECHDNSNWLHPKTRETSYIQRKIKEALEIEKVKLDQNVKLLN